jgi:hypothetical protein
MLFSNIFYVNTPFSIVLVTIIVIPAIAADAGFVPCAEAGIRQIVLCDL